MKHRSSQNDFAADDVSQTVLQLFASSFSYLAKLDRLSFVSTGIHNVTIFEMKYRSSQKVFAADDVSQSVLEPWASSFTT